MFIFLTALGFIKAMLLPVIATFMYRRVFHHAGYDGKRRHISLTPLLVPLILFGVSAYLSPQNTLAFIGYANLSGATSTAIFIVTLVPLVFLAMSDWPIFDDAP
jgi:hypothetical protein